MNMFVKKIMLVAGKVLNKNILDSLFLACLLVLSEVLALSTNFLFFIISLSID